MSTLVAIVRGVSSVAVTRSSPAMGASFAGISRFPKLMFSMASPVPKVTVWVAPNESCPSKTKMSSHPFVSSGTRSSAYEEKATYRPSALMLGLPALPFPCESSQPMLTRSRASPSRSYTNTSLLAFVSPATKFDAYDSKATYRPSALMDETKLSPLPTAPSGARLMHSMWAVCRSHRKMSSSLPV